jgi:hypothetical protein
MMFVAGAVIGGITVVGAQTMFGCFRRQEDVTEIQNLHLTLQQTITTGAGREASLRAENKNLTESLNEANALLAQRVQRVKHEAMAPAPAVPSPSCSAPPPPPPMGKMTNKRTREVYIDSKQLVQEFTAFLESSSNKDRAISVKNGLRLDVATLTRSLDKAVKTSLSSHVGKWLKEEKRPEAIDPNDWEDAVDESAGDHRSEALDRYRFPNANRLVQEVVTHLRQHYRPKSLEAQGSILAELENRIKRPRKATNQK